MSRSEHASGMGASAGSRAGKWRRTAPVGALLVAGAVVLPVTAASTVPAASRAETAHATAGRAMAGGTATKAKTKAKAKPAAATDFLEVASIGRYGMVLTNSKHFTLYVLSAEGKGKIVCTAACEKAWPPVLVSSSVKHVSVAKGVDGKIGFVRRTATSDQVTYNGYPLYLFVADTGPRQSHGEGIVHFGGTWGMVRASAKTTAATEILPAKAKSTTSTTAKGGYGY
jgi:predicted lipoprotein with Yx(FWY)xxD motif